MSNTELYIKDLKDHSDRMTALQVVSAAIGVEVNSEVLVYVSLGLTRTAAINDGRDWLLLTGRQIPLSLVSMLKTLDRKCNYYLLKNEK